MAQGAIPCDLHILGRLSAVSMSVPADSIGSDSVDADDPIQSEKLEHQYTLTHRQPGSVAAITADKIHIARGAGTIESVQVLTHTAPAAANSYTVNVKKNGTTILSSVVTVDNSTTANTVVNATLSVTTFVAGDYFEVNIVSAAGTSWGTGLIVQVVIRENANP